MRHLQQTEAPSENRNDWVTIRSLIPFLWDYRGRAGLALAFLVISKVAVVGLPLALKEVVDYLDTPNHRELALPIVLLIAYGLLRLSSSLFNELRDVVFAKVRHGTMKTLSLTALRQLHGLSLRYHLERKTGALSRDMERGTRGASTLLNFMVFSILPTFVELGLVLVILLGQYTPWFALITFLTVSLYVFVTFKITAWRMKFRHRMNAKDSEANSIAVDSLINYETVKYFNNEEYEHQRYNHTLSEWEESAIKSQTSMSGLNIAQGSIIAGGVTAVMFLTVAGVIDGTMSIGDLVLVNALMLQVFIPLNFLGVVYSQIKHALSDMYDMFRLLQREAEIKDCHNAPDLDPGDGAIRFSNVCFSYQSERPILKDISFTIPANQKVAIVGHSGSGKSTLARLLYRFYDVASGQIEINQQNIAGVTQRSLREAIGIVPQDTVLFNDTIAYNIRYGRVEASEAEIRQAAQMANIHDFIESLPEGYQTVVGERGLKLSGGEKQRVAIARAILKNPKILIFDEATSSLDSKSEQSILEALKTVATHHSTMVIAHRLSTVVDADQILVLDHGEIIERGTHQQLLDKRASYYQMWQLQLQEEQQEKVQQIESI
jgi:ATP-binding cassette subfamily B protein